MAKIITQEGDMLDLLVWRQYGYVEGALEAAYEANPGLCNHPLVLPAGLEVTLPDDLAPPAQPVVRPWGRG